MKKVALALIPLIGFGFAAQANEEASYPSISGELSLELENDWTYQSDDEEGEISDLYPTVTLATTINFTGTLSLNLEATLEPIEDATDDRAFEDLGGYLNILTVNYDTDLFSVYAGKFTPNFGIAWDAAPGLYGSDLSGDYEYAEMIGLGGAINFEAAGNHSLSASTFFADTTFLSDSVGDDRGNLDEADGGLANTEDFSSFAAALDGSFDAIDGLRYHLGFSALSEGDDGEEHQLGYAAAVEYGFNLTEEITATPLIEYAYLDNFEGVDGDNARFVTASILFEYGQWAASAAYQRRDIDAGGSDQDDFVADLTIGYAFENGIGITSGWRLAEEENIDSQGLGILISYALEF